jgi:glycosyltransferase involved in cell wall biosynthesis
MAVSHEPITPELAPPELSVVIPVHNEQNILDRAVRDLAGGLAALGVRHEIVLAENGSRDDTAALAAALAARHPAVRTFSIGEPNYGRALQRAIAEARGELVLCEEIDLCDLAFAERAIRLLRDDEADMVIGSKLMAGSRDERPLVRHAASQAYNALLRLLLGFRGTDTHGLKAFRRAALAPVAARCVVDRDVFASELVIRAYREGLRVREIPVELHEKRPPSVGLLRRVPKVVRNVARLAWALHLGSRR